MSPFSLSDLLTRAAVLFPAHLFLFTDEQKLTFAEAEAEVVALVRKSGKSIGAIAKDQARRGRGEQGRCR